MRERICKWLSLEKITEYDDIGNPDGWAEEVYCDFSNEYFPDCDSCDKYEPS